MSISYFASSNWLEKLSPRKLFLAVWFLLVGSLGSVLGVLYYQALTNLEANVRGQIASLSTTAAGLINKQAHEELRDASQMWSALYFAVMSPLAVFHRSNPNINYVYTMRVENGQEYFVLDTANDIGIREIVEALGMQPQASSLLSHYGENVKDAADAAMRRGESYVYPDIFSDEFGEFISGQAPMFDTAGRYIGYAGIDYNIVEYSKHLQVLQRGGVASLILLLLISTILARFSTRLHRKSMDTIAALEATQIQLTAQRQAAENATRAKSELLAIATHDLKNPLTAIVGLSDLMLVMGNDPAMGEQNNEMLKSINDASKHMAEVVKGILDNEGLEQGNLALAHMEVDYSALVHKVLDLNRSLATKKQQTLAVTIEDGIVVEGDLTRLREATENYISNAVKYSPAGKTISVKLQKREGGLIELRVTDQGPGLTAEDKAKLFNKFQKLSAKPTGGESSTGLGLSIVKTIIELHRGKVGCDSEPGQGASFWLQLPCK